MRSARDLLPGVPLIDSPFFDEILAESGWDAETRRVAVDLRRDGFAVLGFPGPGLGGRAADIARPLFAPLRGDDWRWGRADGLGGVIDAWSHNASVRRIAANAAAVDGARGTRCGAETQPGAARGGSLATDP